MTFWYDGVIILAGSVAMAGVVWSSYKLNKHRREIRVYKRVKLETGYEIPKWMHKLFESTFCTDSEGEKK